MTITANSVSFMIVIDVIFEADETKNICSFIEVFVDTEITNFPISSTNSRCEIGVGF